MQGTTFTRTEYNLSDQSTKILTYTSIYLTLAETTISSTKPQSQYYLYKYPIKYQTSNRTTIETFQKMFTQPNLGQSPQDVFITRFHVLSQLLIEDNYTNMRNLNMANHNFNEIFSYLKGIIRHMCSRCSRLEERNKDLEEELRKIDPRNMVLNQSEKEDPKSLGEAGLKFNQFTPLQARRTNSFATRFITPPAQSKSPRIIKHKRAQNPDDMRQEFKNIEKFISKHLAKYLVAKKQYQLDKDILVNLYRKWIQKKGKTILVRKQMLIKMQITNELKKIFMGLTHNDKFYNGIGFREDLADNLQVKIEQDSHINPNSVDFNRNAEGNGQSLFTSFENGNVQLDLNGGQIEIQQLDNLEYQDLDLDNYYELCQGFEGV